MEKGETGWGWGKAEGKHGGDIEILTKPRDSTGMTLALPRMEPLPPLDGQLPDCPVTIWNSENIDIAAEQVKTCVAHLPC